MGDIARHAAYGVNYNAAMVAGIVDGSVKINPNIQKLLERYDGDILPTLAALLTNEPVAEFQTRDLDLISDCAAFSTSPVIIYAKAYDDGGGLGSGNISYAISKGLIVPISISGQAGQAATLTCQVHAVSSDGDTNPITVGTSAGSATVHGDAYTISSVSLGSAVAGLKSINFEFGFEVAKNTGENGKVFPTLAHTVKRESILKLSTTGLAEATAARLNLGQSLTSTISAAFIKLTEAGVPASTLTATFIKLIAEIEAINQGRPSTVDIVATPVSTNGSSYVSWAQA